LHRNVSYYTQLAGEEAENATHLQALMDAFPEDTRESSLLHAFKSASAAHLEWGARQFDAMARWRQFILTQDMSAPLPPAYWARLKADIDGAQSTFWRATGNSRMVAQITYSLATYSDLTMAIREDVLDLYTAGPAARALLPPETLEKLEQKLRCGPASAPHRMGGERDAIQDGETGREVLLFQLGSDTAMGWMWGDLGALYITLSPWKLLLGALRHPKAWIDGH
jgi:hypothetical protein